jgi:hypothetical protein
MFHWRPIVLGCTLPLLGSVTTAAATNETVLVPPLYDSFVPPILGQSYTDPVFGTSIKRLSNAPAMPDNAGSGSLAFVSTEFPTASPFNSRNTRLVLQHQSYFALYDGAGTYLADLPLAVTASSEPRWSRSDPKLLYYVKRNALMKLDVTTGLSTVVRAFGEYSAIRGRGESDISRDGDHFVFAAERSSEPLAVGPPNQFVFVYTLSTDKKGPVLDTFGHDFDNLYITPDNGVVIGWLPAGTGRFMGVELYDRNMVFQRQLTHAIGHMHLTRDTLGTDLLVWSNSSDPLPLAGCPNGVVKVRLSDAQQTCLLSLDWSLAAHISAADGDGWALVETYAPSDPPPAAPAWVAYTNELLRVKLDGTAVQRLLHHRSRPFNSYGYQPRAALSRDGSRLVFTSNYDLQHILGYPNEYTDVYLVGLVAAGQKPRLPPWDQGVAPKASTQIQAPADAALRVPVASTVRVWGPAGSPLTE